MIQQTAYDRFVAALRDLGPVTEHAGAARTKCPAHQGVSDTSLAVRPIDGSVLVFCHAGCDTPDVAAALGLEMRDLFDDPKGARYPYSDGRVVHRRPDKTFRQTGNTQGTALFHAERAKDAGTVYVVEGEKDVLAVEAAGGTAVCSAGGAGKAHRADWGSLAGKTVVVVADKDDAGERHAEQVALLVRPLAGEVRVAVAAVGKDAADHVAAGRSLADLVDVTPDALADMFDDAWLQGQQFEPLEYHIPGLVPEGLCVLAAPPKSGKSWLVLALAIAASCAGAALGHVHVPAARPVLYFALEDGKRRLQERGRAIRNGHGQADNHNLNYVIAAQPGEALDKIDEFLRRHRDRAPLIIVDTFGKIKPQPPPGANAYQHDYQVAGQLKNLVDTVRGAAMLMVHHTKKGETADFVESISGSYGLPAAADTLLVLKRRRGSRDATLQVTGRDVHEAEYAIESNDGLWELCGDDLREAENEAHNRLLTATLSERGLEVLAYVNASDSPVTAQEVAAEVGIGPAAATVNLHRLQERGLIDRIARGQYAGRNLAASSDLTRVDHIQGVDMNEFSDISDGSIAGTTSDTSHITANARVAAGAPARETDLANSCRHCTNPLRSSSERWRGSCDQCYATGIDDDLPPF
jgi:Fe2+ or Zn2+ uptake regulation protein